MTHLNDNTKMKPDPCIMCGAEARRVSFKAEIYEYFAEGKCFTCYMKFDTVAWTPKHAKGTAGSWN